MEFITIDHVPEANFGRISGNTAILEVYFSNIFRLKYFVVNDLLIGKITDKKAKYYEVAKSHYIIILCSSSIIISAANDDDATC